MSNTSKGKGEKGSKFWIDTCVESPELKAVIDEIIGDTLEWKSPLSADNYVEFELKQCNALLGLDKNEIKEKFSFWPNRGKSPQWDGIALGSNGRTLFLFEAKSYPGEVKSGRTSATGNNKRIIEEAMRSVHDKYYPNGDFSLWTDKYYQIGNRLTFLHKIQELKLDKFDCIKLVFLNFVNDKTNKRATSLEQWKDYMDKVFACITGYNDLPKDVLDIFVDVSEYSYLYETRT